MRYSNSNDNDARANPRKQSIDVQFGFAGKVSKRHRWGVVLAGGDGTRLQPLTRLACGDNRPKQFCSLLGGRTLLAQTRERISGTIDREHVLFVLTKKHEPFFKEELQYVPDGQKIVQPNNQGTLPAILWSLLRLFRRDEHALVAFFPSDHHFANEEVFISTIERTFEFAYRKRDSVILFGARADRPETEYGWIEPEFVAESDLRSGFARVQRFWEKPPLTIATELQYRGCLWNTFVMIGSAGAFLRMIRQACPPLFETFETALLNHDLGSEERAMQIVYDGLSPFDFSRQVLALSTKRLLVANCGEVGWSDLGEPHRFIAALTQNGAQNPWTTADTCKKCGLTRDQIVTLTAHQTSAVSESCG